MPVKIATERLIICALKPDYAESVRQFKLRNREFFQPWSPTFRDDYYELENIHKYMKNEWWAAATGQLVHLYIFHQTDKDYNYILGDIMYSQIYRGASHACYIGYKIDQKALNQGIVTEAARAANEYMFQKQKLHRIEACVMPRNKPCIRTMEKLGFEKEGLSRKLLKINGVWEDHLRFALVNEEMENEIG